MGLGRQISVHVIMRLDFLVERFDACFLTEARPLDHRAFAGNKNQDQSAYLPGSYLSCLLHWLTDMRSHTPSGLRQDLMNELMILSGQLPNASSPPPCGVPAKERHRARLQAFRGRKHTAAAYWMRNEQNAEPRDGDCACASYLFNEDGRNGGAWEAAEWRSRAREFPVGGCRRWYSSRY